MTRQKKITLRVFMVLLLLLFLILRSFSQDIQIDSIITTESRCTYSGTLSVYINNAVDTINCRYKIIAPAASARPLQTGSVFAALDSGTYTVVVVDILHNNSDTAVATVTGSYKTMMPTTTFSNNSCVTGGTSATISVTGGVPPYTFQITNPQTGQVQSSNVFNNLTYNTAYTVRVFDSCGNFQSRVITPTTTEAGAYDVSFGCLRWIACDSFSITYLITNGNFSTHRYPYTLTFSNPDGSTSTSTIASGISTGTLIDTFYFKANSSDFIGLSVTNVCGNHNNDLASTGLYDYLEMEAHPIPQCNNTYAYNFDVYDNSNITCNKPRPDTVTYELFNPAGLLIGSQVNNASFTEQTPGNGYKIVSRSVCGTDTLLFNWAGSPQMIHIVSTAITSKVCKEKTVGATFNIANGIGNIKLVFVSGPASVSLADGTIHHYMYPDTIFNYSSEQIVDYLGAGTYKIYAIDDCGHLDSTLLNVNSNLTRHSTVSLSTAGGCPFSGQINWSVTSNTNANTGNVQITPGNYKTDIAGSTGTGYYTSLDSGTYYFSFNYTGESVNIRYLKNMDAVACDVKKDSIVIAPYQNPYFFGPSITNCSGTQNDVIIYPDYSKGVQPFSFKIISGPQIRPAQNTPIFHNLPLGTYTFLMLDACGNTYEANEQVNYLDGVVLQTLGSTCENHTASFVAPSSPYTNFIWTRPSGTTFMGDTLVIPYITAADTGVYDVEMIVDINGCIDTNHYEEVLHGFCQNIVLSGSLLHFDAIVQGTKALLNWSTAAESNSKIFEIERSKNGTLFSSIGRVNTLAQSGFSDTKLNYSFYDDQPLAGENFYRIKQVNANNDIVVSRIKKVFFGENEMQRLYPNPSSNQLIVKTSRESNIMIHNFVGQKMTPSIKVSDHQQTIDVTSLPDGNYILQILNTGNAECYKFAVHH